jgi:hypothetical protein
MNKKFPLLSKADRDVLAKALLFFNMKELPRFCEGLGLQSKGKKIVLITRMLTFIETGEVVREPKIPAASCAPRGEKADLRANAKMLYGRFKNDAATRAFFKALIGEHFHYTVFGLDWLQERWLAGKPPTYGEFATFWQQEYLARKKSKGEMKKEWALLHFVAAFLKKYPNAEREEVVIAWKQERSRQVAIGEQILRKIL